MTAVALVAVGTAAGVGIGRAVSSGSTATGRSPAANGTYGGLPGGTYGYPPGAPGRSRFGLGGPTGNGFPGGSGTGAGGSSSSNASDGPTDAATIARDADAGIVDITTTIADGEAAGTGMVLTSSGEVLTNNHVIDGATSISVRDVGNGHTYHAAVVGYDRSQDVAVLQLAGATGLTTVKTATSEPGSGAAVVGIGNAGGSGGTPSYAGGAITGTNRTVSASDGYDGTSEKLTGLLATDAGIQAGDSGGPLVDSSGQVVGMDTAASASFSFNGYDGSGSGTTSRGFAIPITTALPVAAAITNGQSSSTVHIGPTAELGVYVRTNQQTTGGADVARATSGGPAAKADIGQNDIITAVDGTAIRDASDLTALMTTLSPGETVAVNYTTSTGASRTTRVTLGTGAPQ